MVFQILNKYVISLQLQINIASLAQFLENVYGNQAVWL